MWLLRVLPSLLCASLLPVVTSCGKQAKQDQEAVRAGLNEYLKNRAGLDMNSMDMKVNAVTFRGKEADVSVSFQAKGSSDPAGGMQMRYVMEQKEGKWVVKGRSGTSEHGGAMQQQPTTGPDIGSGGLPPNHPPVGGSASSPRGAAK